MKLILHAGTHKTGTTSFQRALTRRRGDLQERGYTYGLFDNELASHNLLAHRIARAKNNELDSLRESILSNIKINTHTFILSSEQFTSRADGKIKWYKFDDDNYRDRRKQYLEKLSIVTNFFDEIELYICFRRHDQYAESMYATNILSRDYQLDFDEYCKKCHDFFDYGRIYNEMKGFFSDLKIASYDQMQSNLLQNLCEWMSIPHLDGSEAHEHVTPDLRLILWLRRSGDSDNKEDWNLRARFCRSQTAADILPSDKKYSFWKSNTERREFIASCTLPPGLSFRSAIYEPNPLFLSRDELLLLDRTYAQWLSKQELDGGTSTYGGEQPRSQC